MIYTLQRKDSTVAVASNVLNLAEFKQKGDEIREFEDLDALAAFKNPQEEKPEKDLRTQNVKARYPGTTNHILKAANGL